jgi:murein DD-endopeptidase MepM/ murein hydrolase activator NlpD
VWPAPIWNGRVPYITDHFKASKTEQHRLHIGVDVMYHFLAGDPWVFPIATKSPGKGKLPRAVIPGDVPALAAGEGEIWNAGPGEKGHSVLIDHGLVSGIGVTTFYQHLRNIEVNHRTGKPWAKGDVVYPGDILGLIGGDTTPGGYPLWHLHFGMQFPRKGRSSASSWVDPAPYMRRWGLIEYRDGIEIGRRPPASGGGGSPRSLSVSRASLDYALPVSFGFLAGVSLALLAL